MKKPLARTGGLDEKLTLSLPNPLVVDEVLQPLWRQLVLLVAIKEVATRKGLTLQEQVHVWRPFDV